MKFTRRTKVIAIVLSVVVLISAVAAAIVFIPQNPTDNPWDYALYSFGEDKHLKSATGDLTVSGNIRTNGDIILAGNNANVLGSIITSGSMVNTLNTSSLYGVSENAGKLVHNNVYDNVYEVAGGGTNYRHGTVIYNIQTDSNLSNLKNNGNIPFLRGTGSSDMIFAINMDSNPKTVTIANRGGTSQGINVIANDINAIAKPNHSYRIEYSGIFPNNPTALARIRVENPTGATLATVNAVNGNFTLWVEFTAEQIAADAQSGIRYSLGNVSGNIDIVYTGIVITEIPPVDTVIYDMQTDSNLSKLKNNSSFPFIRGSGSSDTTFELNEDSKPKTVTVANRGGTSQGIQIVATDINNIAKTNHLYRIEYSGIFPNNPAAVARIREENPTGATLATVNAVNGSFTLSVVMTAEQIAADAQAGIRYSLGNVSGNIDIMYTKIVITEIAPPPASAVIYDMQTDLNLSNLKNNGNIPFMRGAGSTGTTFTVDTDSELKTVTVTERGGTSQGIQIIANDINTITKANHAYKIEYSGIFPNNSVATARIRVENPTGATLTTTNAVNGVFTLSVVMTAEQIAADANAGLRYSLGNVSGNIDIVYTGIKITEIPVTNISNSIVHINQHITADSSLIVKAADSVILNAHLLSESDLTINADYLIGGETSKSVIASRNGNITLTVSTEIDFNGIIYAPNGKVTIVGAGNINGRIFAQEIEIIADYFTITGGNEDIAYLGFITDNTTPPVTTTITTENTEPPVSTTVTATVSETNAPPVSTNVSPPVTTTATTTVSTITTSNTNAPVTTTPNTTTVPTSSTVTSTTTAPPVNVPEYGLVEYEYDRLGRLTKVIYDEDNYIEYKYDANGNITKITTVKNGEVQ
jgi:YD repeat-containing protein